MERPDVTVMCAVSLDGRLAPGADSSSRPYGEHIPDHFTEQLYDLRAVVDAVLVGSETVLLDDPQLLPPSEDPLFRVTVDSRGRLPQDCTLLSDGYPTIVGVAGSTDEDYRERVRATDDKQVLEAGEERVDLAELLERLGEMGVEHVLLEGGGRLIYEGIEAGVVDEFRLLYVPFFVGERDAVGLASGPDSLFPDARLEVRRTERAGDFTLVEGTLQARDD